MHKVFSILLFLCITILYIPNIQADAYTPNSKASFLIEVSSERVLYAKNENERLYPASMTKMMSLYLIMEAINQGHLNYTDEVVISEHAASMGGSQIWLKPYEIMSVDALLRAVAIASANDAVVALAEKIAVSEENFVTLMNQQAQEWGLENTHFMNTSGLHHEEHYSTAKDMAIIALHLIQEGKEKLLSYTSMYDSYVREGSDAEVWLVNTNKLLRTLEGTDGLKTGYTSQAGYCITLTTKKDGLRLVGVVMKEPTNKIRDQEVRKLIEYGFSLYTSTILHQKGESVAVFHDIQGKPSTSDLYVEDDVKLHYLKDSDEAKYDSQLTLLPYTLPLQAGQMIGVMEYRSDDGTKSIVDVFIKDHIEKLSYWDYVVLALSELII